jgi:GTP-binding protein
MSMVDGVILLVCATEGPMTQTKFVLKKAISQKIKPIVIINKVDRPSARVKEVENEIFSLFCDLDTHDDLLEYPIFYASGRVIS